MVVDPFSTKTNGINSAFSMTGGRPASQIFLIRNVRYAAKSVAKDPITTSYIPNGDRILTSKQPMPTPIHDSANIKGSMTRASESLNCTGPYPTGCKKNVNKK